MLKESIKKFKESISKQKEQNNKKNIENLVVFLILLIITVIAINTIWGGKKEKTKQEDNTSYKKLAENINNSIESNNNQFNEYNLEENLEDILSKIAGVGKVKVLVTYSETSEVVAMYNEKKTSINTEETDTN